MGDPTGRRNALLRCAGWRTVSGAGWLLYDGECGFCRGLADRWGGLAQRAGFTLAELQAEWVRERLTQDGGAADATVAPNELLLLLPDDSVLGGADALMELCRHIWWGWPLWLLSRFPGAMLPLRWLYRRVAARRHRLAVGAAP